jgi:glycosyltransferase involved in cell wall biosynthesis
MKCLFIGPYKTSSGWGFHAQSIISALLTTPIDLTLRPIYLSNENKIVNPLLSKYENKTSEHYDVIIQNTLPEYFVWTKNSKNIGIFLTETDSLAHTPWFSHCNLMDEIWVHSTLEQQRLQKHINTKVSVINTAVDINKFPKTLAQKSSSPFVFYTIGDGERKNFFSLILAFHSEFDRNEPVELVIKTNVDVNLLKQKITEFKSTLGIYRHLEQYKSEELITGFIPDNDLNNLHHRCNCFVMPSYGESICRPALDALGFGNTPIVTDNTGMIEFINNTNGWVVPSYRTPVNATQKPLPYLYTAREAWYSIDILELRKAMREAYTNTKLKMSKAQQGLQDISQYSYENVGKNIYEKLCT